MRKLIWVGLIIFITLGMLMQHADAKRFGGGRSFGAQRSVSSFSRMQAPPAMQKPASSASRWLGPLAGLAAGGLLASLLMGHGVASGVLSWLAIAGVGLLLWSLLRNKLQPSVQPKQYHAYREQNVYDASSQFTSANTYASTPSTSQHLAGFDTVAFLRDAKVQFIRLQAAYDSKNLTDLRDFTAPEVFGEIQMQLQERGDEKNYTEVVNLEAELLNAESEIQSLFATVQFSGLIKEDMNGSAAPFKEVWHFRKNSHQQNWIVVGIQQLLN